MVTLRFAEYSSATSKLPKDFNRLKGTLGRHNGVQKTGTSVAKMEVKSPFLQPRTHVHSYIETIIMVEALMTSKGAEGDLSGSNPFVS